MGGSFALMKGLLYAFKDGLTEELLLQAITGFVLFALFGFAITFIHSQFVKTKTRERSEDRFDVHQEANVTLHLPLERAFDLCRECVKDLGAEIKHLDLREGKIQAATSLNLKTFGCKISLQIRPIGIRFTEVLISVRPRLRTTMVDYGESLEIIQIIREFLIENDAGQKSDLMGADLKHQLEGELNQVENVNKADFRHRETARRQ